MPRPLYAALPYLCVIVGTGSALLVDSLYALACAALLITAGLIVFHLRLSARTRLAERLETFIYDEETIEEIDRIKA